MQVFAYFILTFYCLYMTNMFAVCVRTTRPGHVVTLHLSVSIGANKSWLLKTVEHFR